MNSKDKSFLEKFYVKESNNMISLENFGAGGFSITTGLGCYSPISEKGPNLYPSESSHKKILHSPQENLTPPYYYLRSKS